MFSIRDIKDFAKIGNVAIGREKENYLINLPFFAHFLFEIGKRALNEKLRSRLVLTKSMDDLTKNHVDVTILPRENGGLDSEKDMLNNFRNLYEKHKKSIDATSCYEIDWSAIDSKENCNVM